MSAGTPPPSIRQGVRVVPPGGNVTVEEVLPTVGKQVGHGNLSFASHMNKAVVVFLKEERHVHQLIRSAVFIWDVFVSVSPLSTPSMRITVSGVPLFIPNNLLENELSRFCKFASTFVTVSLGCRDPKLKDVQSLRRQVFMFLDSPTLEVSFRVKHSDGFYMVYASSGQLKCFECGDIGHKRVACLHKWQAAFSEFTGDGAAAGAALGAASGAVPDAAGVADAASDVAGSADGCVDSLPNRKEQSQQEQQVQMESENISSSQDADTDKHSRSTEEAAPTTSGRDFISNVGQSGLNSQAS